MAASTFDQFFDHALSLDVLNQAEFDRITDDIATGGTTEEDAIAAWEGRAREAVWPFYKSVTWETPTEKLRFAVGDRVRANIGKEWAPATVVTLWYREADWPAALVAPYQMKLERDGTLIFAAVDGCSFVVGADEKPPPDGKLDKAMLLGYGSKGSMREWKQSGYGPLHVCCMMNGDTKSLNRLLRRPSADSDPNNNDNQYRESPLCMAACYGHLHCAILLLAAGADPRLPNCWGKSAVEISKEKGSAFSGEWAADALTALLKRRAEELDAEDAEHDGSVIPAK